MATFKEKFAEERKKQGKGKTFTFEGKSYTTDYAGEKAPKPRPANLNPKSGAAQSGTNGKVAPKSEGLGSRIMKASAEAGNALGSAAGKAAKSLGSYFDKEETPRVGTTTNYKSGGVVKMKEGSAKDMREDKGLAKKSGMSMKKWEGSAADEKHDSGKKMKSGGVVKKATGGSMRGTGAAIRGKGFSGCY